MVWSMSAFVQQFVYRAEGRGAHVRAADSGSTRRAYALRSAASKMATDVRGPLCAILGLNQWRLAKRRGRFSLICYLRTFAVAWAFAERGAPRGLRWLPKPSSSRPYRGWVARSQVANLALAHSRLLVGAAAQVAEARTGFLDAQDER